MLTTRQLLEILSAQECQKKEDEIEKIGWESD